MKYRLMLLLTALIWGCAFVAQRTIADIMGPFSFNALRFCLGTAALVPLLFILKNTPTPRQKEKAFVCPDLYGYWLLFICRLSIPANRADLHDSR